MGRSTREEKREPDEEDIIDGITYDKQGRMKYNPIFHTNHGKPLTLSEITYICKYYDIDGLKTMSLAVGRTTKTVGSIVCKLKKSGEWDHYKNIPDEVWEKII
ncbi:hypothetical protein J2T13_000838 [Paenibacillus sp. DS2015]|uniref:DNA-entry nuclease n=1 Tax=Paenibacillus sp. DS2015 TaxID=3373917 RepID=UPI003D1D073D